MRDGPKKSRMRVAGTICLLLTTAMAGCRPKKTPEERLVESLRRSPFFRTDGVSSGMDWGGLLVAQDIAHGVDLLALYKANLGDETVRLCLACMLIMAENEAYVDYAAENRLGNNESRLWTHVLMSESSRISEAYRAKLKRIVADVKAPHVQFFLAKDRMTSGDEVGGVRAMLEIMASKSVWRGQAYLALTGIPAARRQELLLPYLSTDSVTGAFAAAFVAQFPGHRSKATDYLERLRTSDNPTHASAARAALAELRGMDR